MELKNESYQKLPLVTVLLLLGTMFCLPLVNAKDDGYSLHRFTARVVNTNGTVGLELNGMNMTAINVTLWELFRPDDSIYAVWVELPAGTYYYYWWAYGNGTSHLYNVSSIMNYTVEEPPIMNFTKEEPKEIKKNKTIWQTLLELWN